MTGSRPWTWMTMLTAWAMPLVAQETAREFTMTVRPHEMATATRTEQAGEFTLSSYEDYLVNVPPQCVGAKRCPLLVFIPGAGQVASFGMKWQRIMSDKHGIIVLVLNGAERQRVAKIDSAMTEVLGKYAIDPDKIAILGRCAGGPPSIVLGGDNLNVFSRILPISGGYPPTGGVNAPNKKTEFFLDAGLWESGGNFKAAQELREAGHTVKLVIAMREHGENVDDYDYVGRWLQESWAHPDPATRPAPRVIPGPVPVLTTDIVTKMTDFWSRFMEEPDSIFMAGRRAHQREVIVPVGQEQPSVAMMDMPALAAKYPSIAAALKAAGLTAEQHDAYRVAILSALLTKNIGEVAGVVDDASPLAKNLAFLEDHPDELEALETAGVKTPELMHRIGMDLPLSPSMDAEVQAKKYALGIWYTP